jgi:hypothetical protein
MVAPVRTSGACGPGTLSEGRRVLVHRGYCVIVTNNDDPATT